MVPEGIDTSPYAEGCSEGYVRGWLDFPELRVALVRI